MKSNDSADGGKTVFILFVLFAVNLGFWMAEILQGDIDFILMTAIFFMVFASIVKTSSWSNTDDESR